MSEKIYEWGMELKALRVSQRNFIAMIKRKFLRFSIENESMEQVQNVKTRTSAERDSIEFHFVLEEPRGRQSIPGVPIFRVFLSPIA